MFVTLQQITERNEELEAENKTLKAQLKQEQLCGSQLQEKCDNLRADEMECRAQIKKPRDRKSYLEARNKQLKEDIAELQSLFDLQHTRTLMAAAMWQAETGKDCFPDLGELVRWLMEKAAGSLDKPSSKE